MTNWPYYNSDQIDIITNVVKSNKVNYWTGDQCKKFEKEFSKKMKIAYSVSVANGTLALEIALKALELKTQDEVIVTPRSYIASAICVHNIGAIPIFCDINKNSQNNKDNRIEKETNKSFLNIQIL